MPTEKNVQKDGSKRVAARLMFMEGFAQNEIARTLGVSENTVSKWATSERWLEKRVAVDLFETNNTERVLRLIDYQLRALEQITETREAIGDMKLIAAGDIDGLQKLFTTIRQKNQTFSGLLATVRDLLAFVEARDLELAKRLTEHADVFINEKRKTI